MTNVDSQRIKEIRDNTMAMAEAFGRIADALAEALELYVSTQTETQNSNLTFEKRTMRDCYNCKRYETEGECIECHYEPKTELNCSEIPNNCKTQTDTHDKRTETHECVEKPKVKKPCAKCEYHDWVWDEHFGYGSVCNGIGKCPYHVEETITSEPKTEPQTDCAWR